MKSCYKLKRNCPHFIIWAWQILPHCKHCSRIIIFKLFCLSKSHLEGGMRRILWYSFAIFRKLKPQRLGLIPLRKWFCVTGWAAILTYIRISLRRFPNHWKDGISKIAFRIRTTGDRSLDFLNDWLKFPVCDRVLSTAPSKNKSTTTTKPWKNRGNSLQLYSVMIILSIPCNNN